MNVNREELLSDLELVKSGLSPREFIEQSSCFVFQNEEVFTFNDEVACRKKVGIDISGAVQSTALLDILQKLEDPMLDVLENEAGELEFRGKNKRFGITKDAEIFLPLDRVERPEKWRPLPKEFLEAVGLVQHCVSGDESKFLLTCIHIHPDYVEACDNFQIMRCAMKLGLKDPVLVRGTSLKDLPSLAMDEVALTKSWIHFRNQSGLVYSCRRYSESFPDLNHLLKAKGHPLVIPRGIAKAAERAAVFAVDAAGESQVLVKLENEKIALRGEGATGWYREVSKVAYEGPSMEFRISPALLKQISEKHSEAEICEDKLMVLGGQWKYCTVLAGAKEKEAEEAPEPPKPKRKARKEAEEDFDESRAGVGDDE